MKAITSLTLVEKAIVCYAFMYRLKDWSDLYDLVHHSSAKPENYQAQVRQWKNSPQIKDYLQELQGKEDIRIQELTKIEVARWKAENESMPLTAVQSDGVDFTDPNQFLTFLNAQANSISEEKDRREYLKMISDMMRYKEGSQEKGQDIMRFYTPIRCSECPLHQKEEELIRTDNP